MKRAVFNYPKVFKTLPEYTAHSGQCVDVLHKLDPELYDFEGEYMYVIQAIDGWIGNAFESELEMVEGELP